MDVGNDCWTQSRGSVGKGEDGDICTANTSKGAANLSAPTNCSHAERLVQRLQILYILKRGQSTHLFEIYNFKILATNSNVRYNAGQQIVGQRKHLLTKLDVAQRMLVSTSVPQQLLHQEPSFFTFSPLCWVPRALQLILISPFPGFTRSLWYHSS